MDKTILVATVRTRLSDKVANLEKIIAETRAANNDTKSSMGDKYETSREMVQQEINNLQRQLNECLEQQNSTAKLSPEPCTEAKFGALVETGLGFFYVASSVGVIEAQGVKIHTVSPASPIAKAMHGKSKEQTFIMNGTSQTLKNIY